MNQVAAVIAIAVIAGLAIVMLGAVQTARTRAMTRKRLGEAIPESALGTNASLGTLTRPQSSERVRRATEGLSSDEVRKAADDARAMEDDG